MRSTEMLCNQNLEVPNEFRRSSTSVDKHNISCRVDSLLKQLDETSIQACAQTFFLSSPPYCIQSLRTYFYPVAVPALKSPKEVGRGDLTSFFSLTV